MIKLKEARTRKGINQTQLAKELDVTQAQISMFENGVNSLSSDQIIKLVKVLECSADYLLGLIDDEPQTKKKRSR